MAEHLKLAKKGRTSADGLFLAKEKGFVPLRFYLLKFRHLEQELVMEAGLTETLTLKRS